MENKFPTVWVTIIKDGQRESIPLSYEPLAITVELIGQPEDDEEDDEEE